MSVTYFRQRRKGPETAIEDAVAIAAPSLFSGERADCWIAGAPSLGAGQPDLAVVVFQRTPTCIDVLSGAGAQVLSYLRTVRCASANTIADRLCMTESALLETLGDLADRKIVDRVASAYRIESSWRSPLQEVVAIEAKVSDWKKAVAQAGRNRVFSNRSFIALPEAVALRVRRESLFTLLGVGIIGVSDEGSARIVRQARRQVPRVWAYHYALVGLAAEHSPGFAHAVSGSIADGAAELLQVQGCPCADAK
ncbi:MAG: hypothetical protein KF859_10980 [Phycisphaeraceae bacterium]|nr:hypothetical protein [Phycisphaeraceae bacterium]